ncbi:DEAD-box ATP-dependent RNA helicase 5 [Linum perenne]
MGKKLQEETAQVDDSMRLEKKKNNKKKKNQQKEAAELEQQLNGKHAKRKLEDAQLEEEEEEEEEDEKAEHESRKKDKKEKKKKKREEEPGTQEVNATEIAVAAAKEGADEDKIVVTGKDAHESKYRPLKSFVQSKLPEKVLKCCQGFETPSPIQSHAWPFLLDGRDFIGIAKTGSGKTLAYGIPAIMHVLSKRKGRVERGATPLCLVLAPTRELADQIFVVLRDAGEPTGIRSLCVYGGTPKGPQISSLKSGVDIVIGTPGRLRDLMEMDVCHLKEVSFVVLDEADRMLDMGFRQEVQAILSTTASGSARQMIMFSATWPLDVHKLAEEHMDPNPVKVVVGSEDTAANHDVMQIVEVVDDRLRDDRLLALLEKYHKTQNFRNRVIVFALYQKEAERLEGMLRRSGWKVVGIHGNKAQAQRTNALSLFKTGSCPLMVATDVAARGLDVPDVEVVINYSFPLTTEDYVHRIGRTGRAGKKGVAHTFFTHHNKGLAGELVNVLREAKQIVPESLLKFGTHVKKKESKLYGAHFRELAADAPKAKKITFNSDDED